MVSNSEKLLKSFANRLARTALTEDGTLALSLFQVSGLLGARRGGEIETPEPGDPASHSSRKLAASQSSDCDRIGIWERKKNSPHFIRRLDMVKDWGFWANLGRIEPKRAARRVVLIGESVARGYLYDPQFTPAMALERMLRSQSGKAGIEVIDLARTNLGFSVRDLAISAANLLEPDAVIIFAGNNWGPFAELSPVSRADEPCLPLSGKDVPFLDSVLREKGVAGIRQLAEDQLARNVRRLVRDVASTFEAKGIPLLWIVPEFNLGDWRDPMRNTPYISEAANRQWIAYNEQANTALLAGDLVSTSELATKMVELDGGVSVAGYYLLAECSRRQGDLDSARHYLESARDAVIWDTSMVSLSPRPYSIAQKILREEPLKFRKNSVLDLPAHLKEYTKGALPDRRLFLDYCHMTSEGIQVTMAEAASRILKMLNGPEVRWSALVRNSPPPSNKVEAEAAFLAAVHGAHWHQKYELVSHHCRQAVKFAPEIANVILKFSDVQSRRQPMYMCEAAEKIAEMPWPSIQHYLFQFQNQQLDKTLLDSVLDALKTVAVDGSEELERIRREEHSYTLRPTDLLDQYYCSSAAQPQESIWASPIFFIHKQSHYYQAYGLESRFFFVGEAARPLLLSLTCRLPGRDEGEIQIAVNGKCQANTVITGEWSTWDITVPEDAVQNGVNEVVVRWPVPSFSAQDALNAAVENIRHGLLPEFYPTFGEIHSFTAAEGRSRQTVFSDDVSETAAVFASA